jgi:rod shape-determining protein MreD
MSTPLSTFLVFAVSLLAALLMAVFPLSPSTSIYRPELLCLLVIYWVLYSPHQVGVGVAWCLGLLQDVVEDGVWGGHALALALVAYIGTMSYRRLRTYSMSQQAFWIFVFVGIHQLFANWIQGLNGYAAPARYMIISALVSAACWPLLVLLMRWVQQRYRIF